MEQYENVYPEFRFLGAVPIDFDKLSGLGIGDYDFSKSVKEKKTKLGLVFNLDEHWQPGSHWNALYADLDKNQIYFFDSYGKGPVKRVRNLVKRISQFCYNKDICKKNVCSEINDSDSYMMPNEKNRIEKKINVDYNHSRHQYKDSECGVYSINFILRLLKGDTFEDISNTKVLDNDINKCRDDYFTLQVKK